MSKKRSPNKKPQIQTLGVMSLLVILYLVASLGSLRLEPATPFAYSQESKATPLSQPPTWNGIGWVVIIFILLIVVLIILLPPDQRKKLLVGLMVLLVVGVVIFYFIFRILPDQAPLQQPPAATDGYYASLAPGLTETPEPLITPQNYTPPQVSSWISYLVGLVILSAGMGGWIWFTVKRKKSYVPLSPIAEIARAALDEMEAGKDWGDVILNLYYQMTQVVSEWRGLRRQAGVTPKEFAAYLVSTHLPEQAVYDLTILFERVRYGDKRSDPESQQMAVDALTSIMDYCQVAQ